MRRRCAFLPPILLWPKWKSLLAQIWLDEFSIYAVPMRYDERLDLEPLDREAVLVLVAEVGDWAKRLI